MQPETGTHSRKNYTCSVMVTLFRIMADGRNNYRMDPYHRMDISVTWKGIESKNLNRVGTSASFNVYNRYNPYIIYFDNKVDNGVVTIEAKQISLFPILPSITYNFKF
ncbi:MAG: hypothetical protein IPI10_16270 [Bacteroidetes bacterium]|nr:hypothetical protein [Bacteroidota bacterium]